MRSAQHRPQAAPGELARFCDVDAGSHDVGSYASQGVGQRRRDGQDHASQREAIGVEA